MTRCQRKSLPPDRLSSSCLSSSFFLVLLSSSFPPVLPVHFPSQRTLSNEVDRFWWVLMRTHSTRITSDPAHLYTHARTHMLVHTYSVSYTQTHACTSTHLFYSHHYGFSFQLMHESSVTFTDQERFVCVCVCLWGGQSKREVVCVSCSGVGLCVCGSVCACYITDIVKGMVLHDLSVYICITWALLPRWNIDSLAVALPREKFQFFKETNTAV